jgi:coenzyme PQQ precursor peptide PqqA
MPGTVEHGLAVVPPLPPLFELTVRSRHMKWETPQAVDFRFGMEITMYIANR